MSPQAFPTPSPARAEPAPKTAWLLREAPSEIVAIRPADERRMTPPVRVLEGGRGREQSARDAFSTRERQPAT